MAARKRTRDRFREVGNKKLRRKYHVGERYEAGIMLTGTEVKSIRSGRVQINDAFARIENGRVFLHNAHIAEYEFGNVNNHEPYRPRELLLHRREIEKIDSRIQSGGKALVPTRLYFKKGLIKVEVAICEGKKFHDRREDLKKREAMREAEQAMRARG